MSKVAKFKHNKKRNSAFLYETLIQELTKAVLCKDTEKQKRIKNLVKESFKVDSESYKELKLYKAILETKDASQEMAEKILNEVKHRRQFINEDRLLKEQNSTLKKMKKEFDSNIFSNFVPDYKSLASISQIFNQGISIKSKILLEKTIIDRMSKSENQDKMSPIDNIVFRSFTKRFNEEYSGKLLDEQKQLLSKYITSFQNNGLELKLYLQEEIGRLKEQVKKSFDAEEIKSDEEMLNSSKKVLEILESYKTKSPDKKMVEEISKIQGLVKEFESDVD